VDRNVSRGEQKEKEKEDSGGGGDDGGIGGGDNDDGHDDYNLRIFILVLGISSPHIQPYILPNFSRFIWLNFPVRTKENYGFLRV
jgi:hypothetical protein